MHRIFCATPWEAEAERLRFHDLIGKFNELTAMARGVLLVPVSLNCVHDKRPMQYTIDENIRECRYFILVLTDGWGPVERNFRRDYNLALKCLADPALPMKDVLLLKQEPDEQAEASKEQALPEPRATFSSSSEFAACVNSLLSSWLEPSSQPFGGPAL